MKWVSVLAIVITSLAMVPQVRAQATPETVELFEAGRDGYHECRIPGIVVTAKGTILAYCEARKQGSDWGEIDILMRRSTDGGKTWSVPSRVAEMPTGAKRNPAAPKKAPASEAAITINNPLAIADRDGTVHFLYCVEYGRCFYRRSDDDGVTFSPPMEITESLEPLRKTFDRRVVATGPGHGIPLKSGRLLVPVWISKGSGPSGHGDSRVTTLYSDDGGKTWRAGALVPDVTPPGSPNESAVVELSDGRVMINMRHASEPHFRAVSTSPTGIDQWADPHFDKGLPEPVCMASLARLDDGRVVFSNPNVSTGRERKNVTVRLSDDDGATWAASRSLEPGPSAYSDLAVGPDDVIYCFFERGEKKPYERLTFARFGPDWLIGRR
jgi:sialidase-1